MVVRSQEATQGLRKANRATAKLLRQLARMARPGVTTKQLDDYAMQYMRRLGAEPVFNTQESFPGCINTSVNNAVVHGVPGGQVLRSGDLLSIDAGMKLNGYCGDATITVAVGEITPEHQRLVQAARETMMAGIKVSMPGNHIGDIGYTMQRYAESRGYGVIREYIGHGLGRKMHEPPDVPSVGKAGTGPIIEDGLVITIEPILVEGSPKVGVDGDGWTVRTLDSSWAAQWEHTVLVTPRGPRILSEA